AENLSLLKTPFGAFLMAPLQLATTASRGWGGGAVRRTVDPVGETTKRAGAQPLGGSADSPAEPTTQRMGGGGRRPSGSAFYARRSPTGQFRRLERSGRSEMIWLDSERSFDSRVCLGIPQQKCWSERPSCRTRRR